MVKGLSPLRRGRVSGLLFVKYVGKGFGSVIERSGIAFNESINLFKKVVVKKYDVLTEGTDCIDFIRNDSPPAAFDFFVANPIVSYIVVISYFERLWIVIDRACRFDDQGAKQAMGNLIQSPFQTFADVVLENRLAVKIVGAFACLLFSYLQDIAQLVIYCICIGLRSGFFIAIQGKEIVSSTMNVQIDTIIIFSISRGHNEPVGEINYDCFPNIGPDNKRLGCQYPYFLGFIGDFVAVFVNEFPSFRIF